MENLTHTPETTSSAVPPATPKPRPETQRSAAQIAASRANGAKSKGPKTEEGKRIAALNSRRHGLLAASTVIDGEEQTSFMMLSESLIELFQPADEHEANLVETMLTSMWRRTRALSMQTSGISILVRKQAKLAAQSGTPARDSHHLAFTGLSASLAAASVAKSADADARTLDLLHRYEAHHTRAYSRAVKDLFAYRKLRGQQPIPTFDQSAADQAVAPTQPDSPAQSTSATDPTPSEPRAQASVPNSQPNEPTPTPTPTPSVTPKPHSNHPGRNKFKKNRRRK